MRSCSYCETQFWFGGKADGSARYCNEECFVNGKFLFLANSLPPHLVTEHVNEIRNSKCPVCGKTARLDAYISYKVWSALLITNSSTHTKLSCEMCANKENRTSSIYSFFVGWWGIPWGIIMTPIQIARNIREILSRQSSNSNSPLFERAIKVDLARQLLIEQDNHSPHGEA